MNATPMLVGGRQRPQLNLDPNKMGSSLRAFSISGGSALTKFAEIRKDRGVLDGKREAPKINPLQAYSMNMSKAPARTATADEGPVTQKDQAPSTSKSVCGDASARTSQFGAYKLREIPEIPARQAQPPNSQ